MSLSSFDKGFSFVDVEIFIIVQMWNLDGLAQQSFLLLRAGLDIQLQPLVNDNSNWQMFLILFDNFAGKIVAKYAKFHPWEISSLQNSAKYDFLPSLGYFRGNYKNLCFWNPPKWIPDKMNLFNAASQGLNLKACLMLNENNLREFFSKRFNFLRIFKAIFKNIP